MIQIHQLYSVTTDNFFDSGENENLYMPTTKLVPKGTIIEIRYTHKWHFRANINYKLEGHFGHATPEVIKQNTELIGRVNHLAGALMELPTIIEMELFDKFENGYFVDMPETAYLFLIEEKTKFLEKKANEQDKFSSFERANIIFKETIFSTFCQIEKEAKSRNLEKAITEIQRVKQLFGISE